MEVSGLEIEIYRAKKYKYSKSLRTRMVKKLKNLKNDDMRKDIRNEG